MQHDLHVLGFLLRSHSTHHRQENQVQKTLKQKGTIYEEKLQYSGVCIKTWNDKEVAFKALWQSSTDNQLINCFRKLNL